MIDDHKTQGEWKIQLTMAINFISSSDSNETCTIYHNSNNIEIVVGYETGEIIEELFKSLLQKYRDGLEKSMRGSEFVFDSINILCYKLHKISLYRGGSYIGSPKWLKSKKPTLNPNGNDSECFKYAITIALNHKSIGRDLQKTTRGKKKLERNTLPIR